MIYVNPSNISKAAIRLFEQNRASMDAITTAYYEELATPINFYEGLRKTISDLAIPSIEIECASATPEWFALQSIMTRYSFMMMLTVKIANIDYAAEYTQTLTSRILEVLGDPTNLQMMIPLESRWIPMPGNTLPIPDPNVTPQEMGVRLQDSMITNVTYSAVSDMAIRVAQWDWEVSVHHTFPTTRFLNLQVQTPDNLGAQGQPTKLRGGVQIPGSKP